MSGMSDSPPESSTSDAPAQQEEKLLKITVTSVMQGVKQTVILIKEDSTVQSMKLAIEMTTEVTTEKQILLFKGQELKNNDATIASYGITRDSTVTMNVKMSTGLFSKPTATDMIFLDPTILPANPDQLRKTIKGMHTVHRKPKKMSDVDEGAKIWTTEKQLEAELTRNRMKTLLRRKRHTILASTPVESEIGSVQTYSPVATPPSELASPSSSNGSVTKPAEAEEVPVTEKELRLFFDPPETIEEYKRTRRNLFVPPSSEKELLQMVEKFKEDRKTKCNCCFKKLSAAQQTMTCKCNRIFCDRHRNPQQHMCVIDYKQAGRIKLKKENSKCGEGGARKAKLASPSDKSGKNSKNGV